MFCEIGSKGVSLKAGFLKHRVDGVADFDPFLASAQVGDFVEQGSVTMISLWPRVSSVSFSRKGGWVPSSMRSLSVTASAYCVSSTFAPQSEAMRDIWS